MRTLLLTLVLLACPASAERVTIEFQGEVAEIEILPKDVEGVSVGSVFHGRYVLDLDRPARNKLPTLGFYWAESLELTLGSLRVHIPDTPIPNPVDGVVDIRNGHPLDDSPFDRVYLSFGRAGVFGTLESYTSLVLSFVEPSGSALDSTDLVAVPDLSLFDGTLLLHGQSEVCVDNFDFGCLPPELSLVGEITQVSLPEPASGSGAGVALLGLLSLASIRRAS